MRQKKKIKVIFFLFFFTQNKNIKTKGHCHVILQKFQTNLKVRN